MQRVDPPTFVGHSRLQSAKAEARLAPWSTPRGRNESLRVRIYSTGQAKEGASADSAEEMKDTTGASPWKLHRFTSLENDFSTLNPTGLSQLWGPRPPAITYPLESIR